MYNSVFKLALYGDSLACPRQGIVKSHERYIALIEKHLRSKNPNTYIEIRDKAIGGATLSKLVESYNEDNTYFELPGNILIIHTGIVDCAPRPIADSTRNKIARLPNFIKKRIINYIHHHRAQLLNKNGGYVKTDVNRFSNLFSNLLNHAIQNYDSIFVINICPTTTKIENHSPGFTNNINRYNSEIPSIIKKINSNKINLVDINSYLNLNTENLEKYIVAEDGHHIHSLTHNWIANQIISKIQ